MTTAENIKLNLDEKAHSYAKIYASLLSNEFQRKRSYASLVALYSLIDVLEQSPYPIQKSMTLYKNPQLNEEYEISDLYINGWHVDIRVVTGGDAVLLPKIHFDSDIVPDYYIVVKLDSSLKNAEILGAVDTSNLEKEPFDDNYFCVPFSAFIDYNTFLSKLVIEKHVSFDEEDHELFRNSYLALLDNNLDLKTKNKVLKHLFECSLCRTEFCCFTGFEMVCCHSSTYPEILEDHTLGYIGAQKVDDKKYEGKEETVYIGTDSEEPVKSEVEEIIENKVIETEGVGETVSDILDGLFHVDEVTVAENVVEEKSIEIDTTPTVITEVEEIVKDNSTQEIIEENPEVSSIDDILDEVGNDIEPIHADVQEQKVVYEEDTDLQQLDDSLFLDVPKNFPDVHLKQDDVPLEQGDFQVIVDETSFVGTTEDIEIVSDAKNEQEDLLVIEEEEKIDNIVDIVDDSDIVQDVSTTAGTSEIEPIKDEIEEVYPSDEEFVINDEESEIENIEDEIIDEATMLSQEEPVQKVIVDYDEFGEPVYSYVQSVDEEASNKEEESILEDDAFEEYKDDDSTSEIENISDTDEIEEEYESVYSTDEQTLDENQEENVEIDKDDEINDETLEESSLETEVEDEEPIDVDDGKIDEEEQPSIIDDILYHDSEEDEVEEDTDEEVQFKDEEDEMNSNEEYDEYDEDFIPEDNVKKSSNPLVIIISLLIFLALAGAGAFFFLNKEKVVEDRTTVENTNENTVEIAENPAVNDMFEQPIQNEGLQVPSDNNEQTQNSEVVQTEEQVAVKQEETALPELPAASNNVSMPELTEGDLIKPVQRNSNGDVNKTIVNAFATSSSPVSLRALNWFCASELFTDKTFKTYLQNIDNTLKQNLRSNFMNLVESSPKDTVVAKFAVDNRGNLKKVIIAETSGSTEIDNVVLQSIKETFESEKSQILNDNELKQDMYYLKVAIKL